MQRLGRSAHLILLLLCSCLLAACGGSSTDADGNPIPTTTSRTLQLSLVLLDPAGQPSTRVPAGSRRQVEVTAVLRTVVSQGGRVTSDTSAPLGNLIVALSAGGASFEPSNGNVLTDSQGRGRAVLIAGSETGASVLQASASSGGVQGIASLNFEIVPGPTPRISLRVLDATGIETSTLRAGEVVAVEARAAQVTLGSDGSSVVNSQPMANAEIVFSTDGGQFEPASGRVLTGPDGVAVAQLRAGTAAGAFQVTASLQLGEDTTLSASRSLQIRLPSLVLGSGSPFTPGRLALSQSSIAVGNTVTVSGELRDANGVVFAAPVDVFLSSRCAALGSAQLTSPVRALNGRFNASYTPQSGCLGEDLIEADARLPGQVLGATASAVLSVQQAPAGGLVFVDASATQLALRGRGGSGRPESATLRFRASSSSGIGVPGARVRFSLSNSAGGISLSPTEAVSDSEGLVAVNVTSGTRAVGFRVLASLDNGLVAQSTTLSISSGTADQDSTSLAVRTFNIEGFNIDGVDTELTLRAADFFNNPVADGTLAVLSTEGGAVDPVCVLQGGVCSVVLRSQNPRPADGRVSVLLTLPGDESFTDQNGNGQYDTGEPFEDLAEAFRDDNEDGRYQIGEPFVDRNGNGVRDPGNGRYDGILCTSAGCPQGSEVDVRASTVIVFSTSSASISISPSQLSLDELSPRTVLIDISDLNGNLPPAGSTVEVTTSNGELLSEASFTVGNSNARGPLRLQAQLIGDGEPSSGQLTVSVSSPSGVVSRRQITVTDIRACDALPAPLPPGCQGGDTSVGSVVVNPSQFTVQPNDADRRVTVSVGVFAGTGNERRPFSGVTPGVRCTPSANAADFQITEPATIGATDSTGTTTLTFEIDAGALPLGSVTCSILAGDQSADVRFDAATPNVVRVDAIPGTFSIQPDQQNAELNVQIAVFAQGGGGTLVPVSGIRPVVGACDPGSSSGFFILAPTTIAPTNEQGATSASFVLNSGTTISGSWSCPISAGNPPVTTIIRFDAP
ncbi:hypothetical protein [Pseudomarimonas salicorniae]|uniref:Ig-like domain (Group 1) n=1 Tax=Pseudomarimonas salicorniae TaxID=2933270 RepID=A0ABT0GE58_9GAMM|nr:hypothetical protein [Lysobacter sp. CAU 1642]MCK7592836.1 hypothetical protein [Lysobacter sp. CAU 1642]